MTAPLVILALLGGCLFSRDLLPPVLRFVGLLRPPYLGHDRLPGPARARPGVAQVLPEIGVLLVFAVVFLGIAVWKFDPLD